MVITLSSYHMGRGKSETPVLNHVVLAGSFMQSYFPSTVRYLSSGTLSKQSGREKEAPLRKGFLQSALRSESYQNMWTARTRFSNNAERFTR